MRKYGFKRELELAWSCKVLVRTINDLNGDRPSYKRNNRKLWYYKSSEEFKSVRARACALRSCEDRFREWVQRNFRTECSRI